MAEYVPHYLWPNTNIRMVRGTESQALREGESDRSVFPEFSWEHLGTVCEAKAIGRANEQ